MHLHFIGKIYYLRCFSLLYNNNESQFLSVRYELQYNYVLGLKWKLCLIFLSLGCLLLAVGQTVSASSQKQLAPGPFIDRGNPYHAGNLTTGNATLTTKSGAPIHTTGEFHNFIWNKISVLCDVRVYILAAF